MKQKALWVLAIVLALSLAGMARQSSEGKPSTQLPGFQRGQKVYIAAIRPMVFRRQKIPSIRLSGPFFARQVQRFNRDPRAELRIRKEFEALQAFEIAEEPGTADFVFLVYMREDGAGAVAIAPEEYAEIKDTLDRDFGLGDYVNLSALETTAWRGQSGPFNFPSVNKICNCLVKNFHNDAMKGDKTPSNSRQPLSAVFTAENSARQTACCDSRTGNRRNPMGVFAQSAAESCCVAD
ncbi:MAG TPA: hypothetical protein VJH03_16940 [Blastocatellia bacterium]|nr:hypothetical protein [Blastocatellia bacterium]